MVSFGALKANVITQHQNLQLFCDMTLVKYEDVRYMSWLPPYHDMGKN